MLATLFLSAQAAAPMTNNEFFRLIRNKRPTFEQLSNIVKNNPRLRIAKNIFGQTAFLQAASLGKISIALRLYELGFDVNSTDEQGNTAVILAAGAGFTCTARDLVYYCQGLDKENRNHNGQTAAAIALARGHTATAHAINRSRYQGYQKPCIQNEIDIVRRNDAVTAATEAIINLANQ